MRTGKTLLTDGPVALFSLRIEGKDPNYRLGDTVPLPAGGNLELVLEWQSTKEFGKAREIKLYRGTAQGEEEITGQIDFSNLPADGYGLKGQIRHLFPDWTITPGYLRLEAASGFDPETDERLFRCITNPIWIIVEGK